MKKYRIVKVIGDGTFGSVMKAENLENGEIVAIKKMKKKFSSWPECLKLREVQCLINLRSGNFCHENVIQLKSIFREFNELHFVFEYMEGDMYQLMMKQKTTGKYFTENVIRDFMAQTFRGLGYIHRKGYFHRDMKPENLLMKNDGKGGHSLKIADFGLAREIRSLPPFTDYVSTRWYRAPEVLLKSKNYGYNIDMFACGVIMSELYTLRPLFPGQNETDELFRLCSTLGTPSKIDWSEGYKLAKLIGFSFPKAERTPLGSLVKNASAEAVQLMESLMKWNPKNRPNCTEALNYPFFTKHQFKLEQKCIYNRVTVKKKAFGSEGWRKKRSPKKENSFRGQLIEGHSVYSKKKTPKMKKKIKFEATPYKYESQCKYDSSPYFSRDRKNDNIFNKKENIFQTNKKTEKMLPNIKKNDKQFVVKSSKVFGSSYKELGINNFKKKSREMIRKRSSRSRLNYNNNTEIGIGNFKKKISREMKRKRSSKSRINYNNGYLSNYMPTIRRKKVKSNNNSANSSSSNFRLNGFEIKNSFIKRQNKELKKISRGNKLPNISGGGFYSGRKRNYQKQQTQVNKQTSYGNMNNSLSSYKRNYIKQLGNYKDDLKNDNLRSNFLIQKKYTQKPINYFKRISNEP